MQGKVEFTPIFSATGVKLSCLFFTTHIFSFLFVVVNVVVVVYVVLFIKHLKIKQVSMTKMIYTRTCLH